MKNHQYDITVLWTGNNGQGTKDYNAYKRDHTIQSGGKPAIPGTSDVSFHGSPLRYNPEELLVASLSACHLLWYLHLCAVNNIVVTAYADKAKGTMQTTNDGGGRFTEVTLQPQITIAGTVEEERLQQLHKEANRLCFIANSCNFPVYHAPVYFFE